MNEAGQLSGGPTHTTTRRVDQLIPIDDISQLRSVQAMLEDARLTATTVGSIPYSSPQSSPPDSDLQTPTPAPIPPTPVANNPPDSDPDSCESDTGTPPSDPDWKQKNNDKSGNNCKRSTRANRDPTMATYVQVLQLGLKTTCLRKLPALPPKHKHSK